MAEHHPASGVELCLHSNKIDASRISMGLVISAFFLASTPSLALSAVDLCLLLDLDQGVDHGCYF
jgi:hypothetical protein